MHNVWTESRRVGHFSLVTFAVFVSAIFAGLLIGLRLLLPMAWGRQFVYGWPALAAVFFAMSFQNCFFEWLFHRYILHLGTVLKILAKKHRRHHALTDIVRFDPAGSGKASPIANCFPITKENQREAAAFPVYALPIFFLVFTPELFAAQWILPNYPILLGGYLAVFLSYAWYEIWHSIEHFPLVWWEKRMANNRLSQFWHWAYAFHQTHHANVRLNMAIAGFFGLPVADWCLGTYKRLPELPLNGKFATAADFAAPAPFWPVRVFDTWAGKIALPQGHSD